MPLTMKIQPIDSSTPECFEPVKIVPKSRLRRLFDFSNFLRGSAVVDRELQCGKDCFEEFEPSSVCLDKMVQNFIEESNEKVCFATVNKRHNRCNSGNGCCGSDVSEDEFDSFNCFGNSNNHHHSSSTDACDPLKSLVLCETISERNLLADAAKIVDKNKVYKRKDEISRKIVTDGLLATGYNVSICKSRWEKTSTYPAGEYEYIEAVIEDNRLIIDIDFRSEFEIARSTKTYKAVLQTLPHIFVGKPDRLQKIVNIVSDAAKQSLKKKGMPLPPWRRADYVKAKWLSPFTRITLTKDHQENTEKMPEKTIEENATETESGPKKDRILMDEFEILEIKPKALAKTTTGGGKVVSGLASVIEGK